MQKLNPTVTELSQAKVIADDDAAIKLEDIEEIRADGPKETLP
jgi:hypothetical protein